MSKLKLGNTVVRPTRHNPKITIRPIIMKAIYNKARLYYADILNAYEAQAIKGPLV